MSSRVVFSIRDFSDEYSSVAFRITDILPDGSNYAALRTEVVALHAALEAVSNGNVAKQTIIAEDDLLNDTRPISPYAQRELKWLVQYQDTVSMKKYTFTIPCALLTLMSDGGDDYADIVGITAWATLVTWLENWMQSPEGNAISVNRVSVVGRNT